MLSESALCLLLDEDKLKQDNQVITGGILTTSSGMGMTLVERLRKAGMTFALTDK